MGFLETPRYGRTVTAVLEMDFKVGERLGRPRLVHFAWAVCAFDAPNVVVRRRWRAGMQMQVEAVHGVLGAARMDSMHEPCRR